MRVAMGLALNEREASARRARSSSTTCSRVRLHELDADPVQLRHAPLAARELLSHHGADDLDGIYEAIKENAMLQKYAGGLGNDWTPVRALGSYIKGTNGKSQGVVPFLKVVNDTAVAVNQGGKRKGAVCSYLETWHLDIEEFLELRKNTGDDRRRTHDMNTANWVPDLFMKRVMEGRLDAVLALGRAGPARQVRTRVREGLSSYEARAARGELKLFKKVPAVQLWRKMLSMLFETGHPWITFKDPCNMRSPQQHVGRRAQLQPVHRDHAQHRTRRDRGVQPGLGQHAGASRPRRPDAWIWRS
jgi:ribonucleoside-diphosphate reductase alpha chain